jgi:hypothetical protein
LQVLAHYSHFLQYAYNFFYNAFYMINEVFAASHAFLLPWFVGGLLNLAFWFFCYIFTSMLSMFIKKTSMSSIVPWSCTIVVSRSSLGLFCDAIPVLPAANSSGKSGR